MYINSIKDKKEFFYQQFLLLPQKTISLAEFLPINNFITYENNFFHISVRLIIIVFL